MLLFYVIILLLFLLILLYLCFSFPFLVIHNNDLFTPVPIVNIKVKEEPVIPTGILNTAAYDAIFCHLNVNSLLSKTDEIRDIPNRIKPAVLGITESKLDNSVTNSEVNINGYSIIRNDRNRNGEGVACYARNDLCFNIKNVFSNSLEHVFFEILLPKVKPIAIGIFYRPPNVNNFLEILSNDF